MEKNEVGHYTHTKKGYFFVPPHKFGGGPEKGGPHTYPWKDLFYVVVICRQNSHETFENWLINCKSMCNFFLVCKWKISEEVISSNIADDKIYSPWSFSWASRVRYYCFVCSRAVKYEKYHVQFLRAIFLSSRRVIIPFRWGIW